VPVVHPLDRSLGERVATDEVIASAAKGPGMRLFSLITAVILQL
jgi:hypothetical protein